MASRSEIECLYNAPDSRTLDLTRQACIAGCRLQVNNGGDYVENFSTVCDAQRDSSSLDCNVLGEGIANASLCDVVQAEAATELNTLSTITCNNGTCSEQFNFVYRCVDALNFCEESSGGEKVMKNPSELMANSLCEAQLGFPQLGTRLCASEPTGCTELLPNQLFSFGASDGADRELDLLGTRLSSLFCEPVELPEGVRAADDDSVLEAEFGVLDQGVFDMLATDSAGHDMSQIDGGLAQDAEADAYVSDASIESDTSFDAGDQPDGAIEDQYCDRIEACLSAGAACDLFVELLGETETVARRKFDRECEREFSQEDFYRLRAQLLLTLNDRYSSGEDCADTIAQHEFCVTHDNQYEDDQRFGILADHTPEMMAAGCSNALLSLHSRSGMTEDVSLSELFSGGTSQECAVSGNQPPTECFVLCEPHCALSRSCDDGQQCARYEWVPVVGRCENAFCGLNEQVISGECVRCSEGQTNAAGDLRSAGDTECDGTVCGENEYVFEHRCLPCDDNLNTNAPHDAAGDDTDCVDLGICAMDNGGCDANATCTDSDIPGEEPTCACKDGYEGDGQTCTDINECNVNNGGCGAKRRCANAADSGADPICGECLPGYEDDGSGTEIARTSMNVTRIMGLWCQQTLRRWRQTGE